MRQIAREQNISLEAVRSVKEKGLQRLRIGKARRELLEKFDIGSSVFAIKIQKYFVCVFFW